jgi:hypothetical protein
MLLVYMLIGALGLIFLVLGYGRLIGSRDLAPQRAGKTVYPDLWIVSLLDCEYSPNGQARILPVTKLKLQPTARGCESC